MTYHRPKPAPSTDELPLSSVRAHSVFPGRETLYLSEVAKVLSCSFNHVVNLIEEFEDTGGTSGLKGFSIACAARSLKHPNGNKTPRNTWRVAVTDYDAFVRRRAESHLQP